MACSIEGCIRPVKARGWCQTHYARFRRYGDPLHLERLRIDDPLESFLARVEKTEGCWIWQGTVMANGYGTGTGGLAHRWAWELFRGPIPEGLQIDHLCRVTRCVNPDHLEPVTAKVNNARSESPSAIAGRRSHCAEGHEYTEENTYMYRGKRRCRTCNREKGRTARRNYMRRRRALLAASTAITHTAS